MRNLYNIYIRKYIPTRLNKLSTCFDNLGLNLNMSVARLTARISFDCAQNAHDKLGIFN